MQEAETSALEPEEGPVLILHFLSCLANIGCQAPFWVMGTPTYEHKALLPGSTETSNQAHNRRMALTRLSGSLDSWGNRLEVISFFQALPWLCWAEAAFPLEILSLLHLPG